MHAAPTFLIYGINYNYLQVFSWLRVVCMYVRALAVASMNPQMARMNSARKEECARTMLGWSSLSPLPASPVRCGFALKKAKEIGIPPLRLPCSNCQTLFCVLMWTQLAVFSALWLRQDKFTGLPSPVEEKGHHCHSLKRRAPWPLPWQDLLPFWAHYIEDGPHLLCRGPL